MLEHTLRGARQLSVFIITMSLLTVGMSAPLASAQEDEQDPPVATEDDATASEETTPEPPTSDDDAVADNETSDDAVIDDETETEGDGAQEESEEEMEGNATSTQARMCTREYLPVCGANDKTYGNICEARVAEVAVTRTGACDDDDAEEEQSDKQVQRREAVIQKATKRLVVRLQRAIRKHERDIMAAERKLVQRVNAALAKKVAGRILLQVEGNGEAWYVDPESENKMYLQDGASAHDIMRGLGLGMTNADLEKIPVGVRDDLYELEDTDGDGLPDKLEEALGSDPTKADTDGDGFNDKEELMAGYKPTGPQRYGHDESFRDRLRGKIALQVESRGEAWYINPEDGKRYFLGDPKTAYNAMRFLSLGITNDNLRQIEVGEFEEELQNAE